MPTYVAFLRAINLGAKRKFPKDRIIAATEAAGGNDVETYINTGNVRLVSPRRSIDSVSTALEAAYAAETGFAVPTMVFTPAELVAIAKAADEIGTLMPDLGMHYVSLLKDEPTAEEIDLVEAHSVDGERAVVRGRAVHLLLRERDAYHQAKLTNAYVEKHLGVATNRNLNVIKTLAQKWGSP